MKLLFTGIFISIMLSVGLNTYGQMTLSFTTTDVSCNGGSDGSIKVTVTGGQPPFIYTWSTTDTITTSSRSTLLINKNAGMYWVVVEDATTDTKFGLDYILEPPAIVINSESKTDETCHNANDGTITISVSGGNPPYEYSINGGSSFVSNGGNFTNLSAGNYPVVVRDSKGCSVNGSTLTIINPPGLIITAGNKTDISCNGLTDGKISISASGGVPPYIYSIDGGVSFVSNGGDFTGLTAGSYSVVVQDNDNCSTNGPTLTILEPTPVQITSETSENISCNGANDGTISISASGGIAPYLYSIDGGASFQSNGGNFSGLSPGNYDIAAQDNNGCLQNGSTITLTEPQAIVINAQTKTDVNCYGGNDGTITVVASGGSAPYEYSIDDGTSFVNNGGSFSGLIAGDYVIAVRDSRGCVQIGSTLSIGEPTALTFDSQTTADISCFGSADGKITLILSGGTPPYQYSIDGGASYLSNGGVFTGLSSGTYSIYGKDSHGCNLAGAQLNIQEPSSISIISEIVTDVICKGADNGTITITASGGNPPYVFSIDGGATYVDNSGLFTGVAPGNYDVVVKDSKGCTQSGSTLVINEPTALVITDVTVKDVTCNGNNDGGITIVVNGGVSPYTYSIDGGAGFINNGGLFTGLVAGNYQIAVRDNNLCIETGGTLTISEPPELFIDSVSVNQPSCNGVTDGSMTVYASGGNGPYLYSIDGGANFVNNGGVFNGLDAGTYTPAIQDANACILTGSMVTITNPETVEIDSVKVINISCFGSADGKITIYASGGTPPYLYSVNGGAGYFPNGGIFENLPAGNYDVAIMDDKGCQQNGGTYNIQEPAMLSITSETSQNILCYGANDGEISIAVSGGTSPYNYSIDGGLSFEENGGIFNQLAPGTYHVAVRDANGCTQSGSSLIITEPPTLTLIIDTTKATCNTTTADGSISITAGGGTPGYTYSVNGGANWQDNPQFLNLIAGNYEVFIRDNNLCTLSQPVVLESKFTVIADAGDDVEICPGNQVQLQGSGGGAYQWQPVSGLSDPSVPNPLASPQNTTIYALTVTKGVCASTDSVTVTVYDDATINAGNDTVIFKGSTISLEATGGTFASYFWAPPEGLSSSTGKVVQATPEVSTLYKVTGTTTKGCVSSDTIFIRVISELKIPSGFTPNGDGYNDTWEIDNAYLFPSMTVQVVNRWGQNVFYSRGYGNGLEWDGTYKGKDLPIGTYYFVIDLNDGNNTRPITGPVTIVR